MSHFEIEPDIFFPVKLNGEHQYMLSAKYDRIDAFYDSEGEIGHFILKIYDDEEGFVSASLDGEMVGKIVGGMALAGSEPLPIVPRHSMHESEHEAMVSYRAETLNDAMFDFAEIDEATIIAEYEKDQ